MIKGAKFGDKPLEECSKEELFLIITGLYTQVIQLQDQANYLYTLMIPQGNA